MTHVMFDTLYSYMYIMFMAIYVQDISLMWLTIGHYTELTTVCSNTHLWSVTGQ